MSGAQTNWWEAAPLAGSQPPPSPAAVTPRNWWEDAPLMEGPREVSPVIAGIQDDRAKAAPARVIANASLFPNLKDRIPVFAKAMNIPPERFAIADGDIVYADEKNPNVFYRVEPSVIGARGPADAAGRVGLYAAGSVGPAIPALAGLAAGALTSRAGAPTSVAAATAASAAGDTARQALGRFINGGDPTQIDWENVAGQAALGGIGQAAGRGIEALYNRAPAGMAAADKEWFRNPANVAQAQADAALMRREGITAMQGPVTNRGSLIQADRQMMRNANTADPMRETVRRVNMDEVPTAAERAASRIAPNDGVDQSARALREAAAAVVESPRQETNLAAREAFRLAQAEPDQWNAAMRRILSNQEMQGLYRSAATRAERDVTLRTPGAVSLPQLETVNGRNPPPFQAWQYMRQELDARAAAARAERDFNTERQMGRLSDMLDNAIREVNPAYVRAQTISAPGQQITARLNQGVVGAIAKAPEDAPAPQLLAQAFSPSRTSPAAIAESRQAFANAGQIDAWENAFSAYVRSVADTAQKTLASGDTGNVAGKIHAELFSTEAKRNAVAAALGGRNTPAYQQFAETMRAFEIASRIPAMGSQTATDLGQIGAVASPAARTVAAPLRLLSPSTWANWGNRLADTIETRSASNAALRTATNYAAGPNMNGAMMESIRIMNPALAGLLTAGARGGAGLLAGMLPGAPSETGWQPYQPPLPRP